MIKINLQLFATKEELLKRATTNTSKKSFAQDVKDRLAAGKSESQAMREAASGREETIDPRTGATLYGSVRSGGSGGTSLTPEQQFAKQQAAIIEAKKRQNISALQNAERMALGATGRQRGEVGQQAVAQRTGLKTESARSRRSLAEYLASRGLSRSGAATGGQIAQDVTLQGGLTGSRAAETRALGDISQRESDIRQQTAQGIAAAEAGAGIEQQQFELQQLQQAAQRQQQLEGLEAERAFQAQQQALQNEYDQAQAAIDLEIENARRDQDFEREKELLDMKQRNALELRRTPIARSGGSGGSIGSGGLTDRQLLSDASKGLNNIYDQTAGQPISVQQNRVLDYAASLRDAGYPDSVIQQMLIQAGISSGLTTGGDTSLIGGLRQ